VSARYNRFGSRLSGGRGGALLSAWKSFNLTTGEVMNPPADESVRVYPLQIEDGVVMVEIGKYLDK